jgi:hypothetical protein
MARLGDACFSPITKISSGKFCERDPMKPNLLATLVLRLLGIYCLLQFIPTLTVTTPAVPILMEAENLGASEIIMVTAVTLFLAFQLLVGILLIVKSVSWGERLAGQNASETNASTIAFEQLQALAFAVAGVLIFTAALPQLFSSFVSFFISIGQINRGNQYSNGSLLYSWRSLLVAIGVFLKAAVGLWMFFGAQGFVNFWRSLRNFGTTKPPG